jgi:hypothetical protein
MIPISEHAPRLLGLGTASPTHRLSQSRAMALAALLSGWPEAEASKLRALYRRTGIETRGSVLLGPDAAGEVSQTFFHAPQPGALGGPGSRERFGRFEADAPELGERAALKAMHAAGAGAADITHLVAVSCTGVSAPSLDASDRRVPRRCGSAAGCTWRCGRCTNGTGTAPVLICPQLVATARSAMVDRHPRSRPSGGERIAARSGCAWPD